MGWLTERTAQEFIKIDKDAVVVGHWNNTVIDVFRLMHEKNISSIALVNDQHQLVSSISVSDIRVRTVNGTHKHYPFLYYVIWVYPLYGYILFISTFSKAKKSLNCMHLVQKHFLLYVGYMTHQNQHLMGNNHDTV
jgi:hypothetical protein